MVKFSASLIGSKIVFFAGGGRHNSNATYTLDLQPTDAQLATASLWMGSSSSAEKLEISPMSEEDCQDFNEDYEEEEEGSNSMQKNAVIPLISPTNSMLSCNDNDNNCSTGSGASISTSMPLHHDFLITKPIIHCHERDVLENQQTINSHFPLPSVRSCAVSIHIGRYLLIFGGWSLARSEMNDLWVTFVHS